MNSENIETLNQRRFLKFGYDTYRDGRFAKSLKKMLRVPIYRKKKLYNKV